MGGALVEIRNMKTQFHSDGGVTPAVDGISLQIAPGQTLGDLMPASHDANLRNIGEQVRSQVFLAYVSASTGTSASRKNCHPFRFENALFMHDGQVVGYERIKRKNETSSCVTSTATDIVPRIPRPSSCSRSATDCSRSRPRRWRVASRRCAA